MKLFRLVSLIAVFALAVFLVSASVESTNLADDRTTVTKADSTTVVSDALSVATAIENVSAVANYANRVTATVERISLAGGIVQLPEAPASDITHPPEFT